MGGKITLIKARLSYLLVYYISVFKMLKSMIARYDCIMVNFLWEGQISSNKLHLLKCSKVIKLISGELGIDYLDNKIWDSEIVVEV